MEVTLTIETTVDVEPELAAIIRKVVGREPEVRSYRGIPAEALAVAPIVLSTAADLAVVTDFVRALWKLPLPSRNSTKLRVARRNALGDEISIDLETQEVEALTSVLDHFFAPNADST